MALLRLLVVSFLPTVNHITSVLEKDSRRFAVLGIDEHGTVLSYEGVSLPDIGLDRLAAIGKSLHDLWRDIEPLSEFVECCLGPRPESLTVVSPPKSKDATPRLHRLFSTPLPAGSVWHGVIVAFHVPPVTEVLARNNRLIARLSQLALHETPLTELLEKAVGMLADHHNIAFIHALAMDEGMRLQLVCSAGWSGGLEGEPAPSGWAGTPEMEACRVGERLEIDDLVTAGYASRVQPELIQAGARSCICVPVITDAGPYGVVAAYSREPGAFSADDAHILQSVVDIISQTAQQRCFQERIRTSAQRDPLTRVLNRGAFMDELERELESSRENQRSGAVLFLDLDHFKGINDSAGHAAGDKFLVSITRCLSEGLRPNDLLARLGGDEFAVLLRDIDVREASRVGRRLLASVRALRIIVDGKPLNCTASAGISFFPKHGTTAGELIKHADAAMYGVKQTGRNNLALHQPKGTARRGSVPAPPSPWQAHAPSTMGRDHFTFFAQPIISLQYGQVHALELLLRLRYGKDNYALPGPFLRAAEGAGLVHLVDSWVIEQALQEAAQIARLDGETRVTFNLAAPSLSDEDLPATLRHAILTTGASASAICIEIAESAAVADLKQTQRFIASVREMGFAVALDDFGAGFSSFSYLKNLPVDYLKIDGALIRDLPQSREDQFLVRALADIGRGLGVGIIAEHVGDADTVELLQEFGVDYGQGFYLARPMPVAEAVAGLRRVA